jgi:hypothetical protein
MGVETEKILKTLEKEKTTSDRLDNIKASMNYVATDQEVYNTNATEDVSSSKSSYPKRYSYVPNLSLIFSNGEVYDLLNYTTIVQVEVNLDHYVFPLISLRLDVPITYIPRIQFDDELEIKFELMYNATTEVDTANMYDTLWSFNMKKVKQESSPINTDELLYEQNDQYTKFAPIELKMIPVECLNANKSLFSGVYGNCNIMQMLALITENLNNKTYIVSPDNIREYKQIIFPPSNIFYAIEYLDQYYGVYDRGLKMFYGFDQSIVMPKNYYIETGINKVNVSFSSNLEEGIDFTTYTGGGLAKIGDDNYITITPDKIKILDRRQYIKEALGTIVNTYSRDDNAYYEQVREYDYTDTEENSIEKVKSYINKYNNTNKEKEYLLQSAYTRQIELLLNEAILDPSSWFKPFVIEFESENYESLNGRYSMNGYYFRFSRVSDSNNQTSAFNTTSAIELIQI